MAEHSSDNDCDQLLQRAFARPPEPDFEAWNQRHSQPANNLSLATTTSMRRWQTIRRWGVRLAVVSACAVALVIWFAIPRSESFANAAEAVDRAQTMTWTTTTYKKVTSLDGKRSWISTSRVENSYMHPGKSRMRHLATELMSETVTIWDGQSKLTLMVKDKLAIAAGPFADRSAQRPFSYVAPLLRHKEAEFVGQRKFHGRDVNVIRVPRQTEAGLPPRKQDLLIDAETKQLVGLFEYSGDIVDFEKLPERNNPPDKKPGKIQILGFVQDEIVTNPPLAAALFSLIPPNGYRVEKAAAPPAITEPDLVKFLHATAQFNGGTFLDTEEDYGQPAYNKLVTDPTRKRTPAEAELIRVMDNLMEVHRTTSPFISFKSEMVPNTFRYLGKNVKLGTPNRIICWYQLKSTGKYRAIFADLSIKDVTPKDLPIPIDR